MRIFSQAHSGTKRQNGKPGFSFSKEQIQHQDHGFKTEHLEVDGNGVWTESQGKRRPRATVAYETVSVW